MATATVLRLLAMLALLAAVITLPAATSALLARVRDEPRLDARRLVTPTARLWLAWVVAATATLGSLHLSEVIGLVPCRLCWFQRIGMYPLSLVLLIAAVRRDHAVGRYAIPLAAVGASVSGWHYLVQWFPQLEGSSCAPTTPCAAFLVRELGFISIPLMALVGFLAVITALAGLGRVAATPTPTDPVDQEPT